MAEKNSIVNDIYQQFIDYFGESRVDIQKYSSRTFVMDRWDADGCNSTDTVIYVHWPTVKVTNEFDESVEIWDLYAGTVVSPEGKLKIGPLFNRSTYDVIQWNSDYAHSHLSGINKGNIRTFRRSCLGSGPINGTISKLKNDSYSDLDIWNLYIWELDKYVHVESIAGIPYRKIRNIGKVYSNGDLYIRDFFMVCSNHSLSSAIPLSLIRDIAGILLKNKVFRFCYYNGSYSIGMPFVEAVMQASNAFIEYYNTHKEFRDTYPKEQLINKGVIVKLVLRGNMFYPKNSGNVPIEDVANTELFMFKGKPVVLTVKDFKVVYSTGEIYAVSTDLMSYIVYSILKYINVKYGGSQDSIAEKARII